ncbi:MAG: hypothetical protein ACJATA_001215 [Sphingobacteriales bacterium]|jgi:hypothetical protein
MKRPKSDEYLSYYHQYIEKVPEGDPLAFLKTQSVSTQIALSKIPQEKATFAYAEGKWTINELIGHMIDTERVMAMRALAFSRKDQTEMPGFDHDIYVKNGNFNARPLRGLSAEFGIVRSSTISLFSGMTEEMTTFIGTASGGKVSVRALCYIILGHENHHMKVLKEKYLNV